MTTKSYSVRRVRMWRAITLCPLRLRVSYLGTRIKKHISAKDILTKKWGLIVDSSVTSTFIRGAATALTK
jgi:hypothetical protein